MLRFMLLTGVMLRFMLLLICDEMLRFMPLNGAMLRFMLLRTLTVYGINSPVTNSC